LSKLVSIFLFLLSFQTLALVPVEGLILGEANVEYQVDPLNYIFKKESADVAPTELEKFGIYKARIQNGMELERSCSNNAQPKYASSWDEKQAKRNVAATLQYIGLDTSVKMIGAMSKIILKEEEFKNLADNLVTNYCSKNLTVYSLRLLRSTLTHYYNNPMNEIIPDISSSPYAPLSFKSKTGTRDGHSKELNLAIRNFKSFCSWGNDVSDYRLIAPYLKNKFVMAEVFRNLNGWDYGFNVKYKTAVREGGRSNVFVNCDNLICRRVDVVEFRKKIPRVVGSRGIYADLESLYCHHFRFQDYKNDTIPQVRKWIKEAELEDPILETSFFFSILAKVPDPTVTSENYSDLQTLAKTSFEERWNKWSSTMLSTFSTGLLFEESLKVKIHPRRNVHALNTDGFGLDLSVTLGELDRILNDTDKFKLSFSLKLTKNYMRYIRTRWLELSNQIDSEGQKNFKHEIAKYIELQIVEKEKLFSQRMWNKEFSSLIADELLAQTLAYRGTFFDSYKEELLTIPVNFSYGVFALGYIRYRADVNAGRLK
jgi:hypothetical protein